MSLSGNAFRQFLSVAQKQKSSATKIVIGNESGDLDSSIGSLIHSFYLSNKLKSEEIIPILNYPSEDLALRPETIYVLEEANCNLSELIFINQVDIEKSIKEIYLVDHNRLSNRQKSFAPLVISVVDHHVDESSPLVNLKDKKIEVVGSACTLVAENILLDNNFTIDSSIAKILLSVILSDTFNLSESGGRTTQKDKDISNQLAQIIDADKQANIVQKEIFEKVEQAKYDTKSMTSADLLRKDYKQWELPTKSDKIIRLGISAAPISFQEWDLRTDQLEKEFKLYSEKNNLDVSEMFRNDFYSIFLISFFVFYL